MQMIIHKKISFYFKDNRGGEPLKHVIWQKKQKLSLKKQSYKLDDFLHFKFQSKKNAETKISNKNISNNLQTISN